MRSPPLASNRRCLAVTCILGSGKLAGALGRPGPPADRRGGGVHGGGGGQGGGGLLLHGRGGGLRLLLLLLAGEGGGDGGRHLPLQLLVLGAGVVGKVVVVVAGRRVEKEVVWRAEVTVVEVTVVEVVVVVMVVVVRC